MSKNNVPYNQPIEESKDKPLLNIFTKSKVQKLLNEQLEFTQGVLKDEKPVTGILTVASVEDTDEEEAHGESLLTCSNHLYYSLMLGALDTILTAMDEGNNLGKFGLNTQDLASEVVDYLFNRINTALNIESVEVGDLNNLLETHPEMEDFVSNHFSSFIFVADED